MKTNNIKHNIKIAVADDFEVMRDAFVSYVNSFKNCKVVADAGNGMELMNKLTTLDVLPDICILDISMPVLNGYDTAMALKKRYPEMKILAITIYHEEYSIIRMIKSGANGYLLKNCTSKDLHDAIESIHTSGYYYSKVASEEVFIALNKNKVTELTEKEIQVLTLFCTQLNYLKIAEKLHISVRTVHHHQAVISRKLNLTSRTDLALFAIHSGIVPFGKH